MAACGPEVADRSVEIGNPQGGMPDHARRARTCDSAEATGDNMAGETFFRRLYQSWPVRNESRVAIVTWIERAFRLRCTVDRPDQLALVEHEALSREQVALGA